MSAKAMAWAWKQHLDPAEKLLLLHLADNADCEGEGRFSFDTAGEVVAGDAEAPEASLALLKLKEAKLVALGPVTMGWADFHLFVQ